MATDATEARTAAHRCLARALGVDSPFPWQRALLDRMLDGRLPNAVDVPTGLGKTAVLGIWLVARAFGAPVPRRIVYVVDRRAVVDQATDVAMRLRELVSKDRELQTLASGRDATLPISTLRGQFADNRQWLIDPSAPAIVLGTVDMVGSRLLFGGYGVSRKMRPYHAGLLGVDTLLALDEAHLVEPFERLLRSIADAGPSGLGGAMLESSSHVPPFRLLSLSATGRDVHDVVRLGEADRDDPVVQQRLAAAKSVVLRESVSADEVAEHLAAEALQLAKESATARRIIVFCNRRRDAQLVHDKLVHATSAARVALFVGARRVWERQQASRHLTALGFLAGVRSPLESSVFVVATSAAEVGVDLDADDMVGDLVAWERMVQRLGRVNRRGECTGDSHARVVVVPLAEAEHVATESVTAVIASLPKDAWGGRDASPGALVKLKETARHDSSLASLIAAASTASPLVPALTRPLLQSWSMTSIEAHTGRPELAPWLRGWVVDDEPPVTLFWRTTLPVSHQGRALSPSAVAAYWEAAPPHLLEQLETGTADVASWLLDHAKSHSGTTERERVLAISHKHDRFNVWTPGVMEDMSRDQVAGLLRDATVLVDIALGGLSDDGLWNRDSTTATDVTVESIDGQPATGIRIYRQPVATPRDQADADEDVEPSGEREPVAGDGANDQADSAQWRQEVRIPTRVGPDGTETEWLVVDSHVTQLAETEEARALSPARAQLLEEHQSWTEAAAKRIAERLNLDSAYRDMLCSAARLHDEGKRADRWQRAFRAPDARAYGKTNSRPNLEVLGQYRHEVGSLPAAERDARVAALPPALRDLCLHLIAAHHGNARPFVRIENAPEPPLRLEARAREIALRFARLEHQWGAWGLCWWESLLRAADQIASRANDEEEHRG